MYRVEIDFPSGTRSFHMVADAIVGGQSEPRLREVNDPYRAINPDKSFENSRCQITLDNTDNFFSSNTTDWYVKGRALRVYDGAELIFTGKISDIPRCPHNEYVIVADFLTTGLDLEVNKKIYLTDYPNAPEANVGQYGNYVYGTADDTGGWAKGILTAYRVDTNSYLAAWNTLSALIKVYSSAGADITGSCALNVVAGISYITYVSSDEYIYFCAYGPTSGGFLVDNPATLLNTINTARGYWTLDGVAAAEAIYAARGYCGCVIVVDDGIMWKDFFQLFAENFDCNIFLKADGHVGIKALDWGGEAATLAIHPVFVDRFEYWRDIKEINDELQRMYWYHYRDKDFQRKPSDVTATTSWEATADSVDLRQIKDDWTAQDVTARIIMFRKVPLIYYNFRLPKKTENANYAKTLELGDVLSLNYAYGYYPHATRLMQIYRKKHLRDSPMIELECIDITSINDLKLLYLWDDADPAVVLLKDEANPACEELG